MQITTILTAMLAMAPWHDDRFDTPEARADLYRPIAQAVAAAAGPDDRELVAALIAQSWHETKLARYVVEGRCVEGPKHARCDLDRHGRPRARGQWQVHRWCRAAWASPEASGASLAGGARCAASMLRAGRARCKSWLGAFAGMRGSFACTRPNAAARVVTMRGVLERLNVAPYSS